MTNGEPTLDLVIGAAYGYSPAQVAPFVRSLMATGYLGRTALVITRGQHSAFQADKLFGAVDLVVVRPLRPPLKSARPGRWSRLAWLPYEGGAWLAMRLLAVFGRRSIRVRHAIVRNCFKPHLARFLEYLEYVAVHDVDRVLMTDVRDVVFQRNPSDWMGQSGLSVGIEFDRYTIGSDPTNAAWIAGVYGEAGLRKIRDHRVSCSGVTWGDRAAVTRYLGLMAGEILATNFKGPWWGIDQAYHNWLLWSDRLGKVNLQSALQSDAATLSLIDLDELAITDDGVLLNWDGSIPGIIHMYDRVSGLDLRLAALLRAEQDMR